MELETTRFTKHTCRKRVICFKCSRYIQFNSLYFRAVIKGKIWRKHYPACFPTEVVFDTGRKVPRYPGADGFTPDGMGL